ncbi:MAG: BON domain-containing protein [Rhodospirillaceae bacterium]|nr:BON domain-containing protein [Rhodospirillales bacterium]
MNKVIKTLVILASFAAISPLVACAQTRTSESAGQYIDNSAITTKVKAAIMQDDELKVLQIHVTTYKDTVQLSGFVDTPRMISRAEAVARAVEGVKYVNNDLIVK